jgi:hypothetical protein
LGYKIVSFQEYPEMGWIFMSLKRNSKANVFQLKSPKHGSIRQHNAYIKWWVDISKMTCFQISSSQF